VKKLSLLIAFTTLVTFIILWTPNEKLPHSHLTKRPQEYMTQVSITSFTEEGQLKNHLSAAYWAYLPETQISKLTTPHLTVYRPNNTVWLIDAKQGQIQQPTIGIIEQIKLLDTVVLQRPKTQEALPVIIETDELNYHPKTEFAETDKAITLTKPGLQITGVGLNAYIDKSLVELLHQVKTTYVPHTNS